MNNAMADTSTHVAAVPSAPSGSTISTPDPTHGTDPANARKDASESPVGRELSYLGHLEALIFEVDGRRFAVPLADVDEVLPSVTLTLLPRKTPAVEGVLDLRGRIVPVISLRELLRLPPEAPRHTDQLIVVRMNGERVALRVHRALGLFRLTTSDTTHALSLFSQSQAPGLLAHLPDGPVSVLDLGELTALCKVAARLEPPSMARAGGADA